MVKNPDVMRKAHEEVDEVLGDQPIQVGDLSKLKYLAGMSCVIAFLSSCDSSFTAILRETLRMRPSAPMRTVAPFEDTIIGGGKYLIKKGQTIVINAYHVHKDPAVYGDDVCSSLFALVPSVTKVCIQAKEFKPERMLDGKFESLPVCPL